MNVFSITSYLVRAFIFLCLIHWSSTYGKKLKNFRDHNDTPDISTNYQHNKVDSSRGKLSRNETLTESDLDVVHKRQKRCLLTMIALGSVAGFSDWFWNIAHEEPEIPTLPPRPKPTPQRTTTTRRPAKTVPQKRLQTCATAWGLCVSGGKPDYNLKDASYIMDVELKVVMNVSMLQFRHPITKEIIQMPRDVPDEYVITETQQVFIIFIDNRGRTFLIFKRPLRPDETDNINTDNVTDWAVTDSNTNIFIIVNHLIFFSNTNYKNVGRLVMNNVPKYNPATAVFIMNVRKKIVNGIWVLEFLHPPKNVLVQVPMDMGDDYIIEKTHQIFKIFVDSNGKTFMIFAGFDDHRNDATKLGVPSINNVPSSNLERAIWIHVVVQKVVHGILMIEFLHPDTETIIQVPFNIGDVHIEPSTQKVFLIFVDNKGQTLLIFKGLVRADISFFRHKVGRIVIDNKPAYNIKSATFINDTRQKCGLDGKPVLEWIHPITQSIIQIPVNVGQLYVDEKTKKVYIIYVDVEGRTFLILKSFDGKDRLVPKDHHIVGKLVIKGVPEYDLLKAITVMETELKVLADGSKIVVFEHPITKQRVQIPPNIGDEHVDKKTQKVFIIFVDISGRTFLIFKGWRGDDDQRYDIDPLQIGYLVFDGIPRWNLRTAIVIRETVQKIASDGSIVIEFKHPILKQNVQIPRDKGDDYVMKKTGEIFKIFIGHFQRTFLIFKAAISDGGKDLKWKSGIQMVVRGVPKYDLSKAIFIEDTEQILDKYGRIVIVFKHPMREQKNFNFLEYNNGDDYVNPKTKRVYKICVDTEGNTLMVYARNERDKKELWITVVKRGFPAYDLSKAIFILDVETKIKRRGTFVTEFLEFRHPLNRLKLSVSTAGADRYVKPGTQQVFLICVDNRGRTLLIFEGMQKNLVWQKDPDIKMIDFYPKLSTSTMGKGSVVIGGHPPYDISHAIYVFKVITEKAADGIWRIVFKHPKTREIIRVPIFGGDEYVEEKTGKVFIIYVDGRKETILIFKSDGVRSSTISSDQISSESEESRTSNYQNMNQNINVNINRNVQNRNDVF